MAVQGHHALWEIDWPTFQSTDGGSVPAGRELASLQYIKNVHPAPGLRTVSFMSDRALLSVPELLYCMPFRKYLPSLSLQNLEFMQPGLALVLKPKSVSQALPQEDRLHSVAQPTFW